MFEEFISQLGTIKNAEIPFYFRNQFKIKENFINPNSKYFDGIVQKQIGLGGKVRYKEKMGQIMQNDVYLGVKNVKTINPNKEEWIELASILKTDETILKQRWITLINPVQKSLNWDPKEDEIICSLMNEQDEKHIWTFIALELYNQNGGSFIRTPKQIRERWMNYLNPKLNKANWTQQEDIQLLTNILKNGKRWSQLSSVLQGRTENQVKNRFKSLMQKIFKDDLDDHLDELQAIQQYLNKSALNSNNISSNPVIQKNQSFQDIKYKTRKTHNYSKLCQKTTKQKIQTKTHFKILKNQQESIHQQFINQNNSINQKENNQKIDELNHLDHPQSILQQQQPQISDNNNIQTPSTLNPFLQPLIQQQQNFELQQQKQNYLIFQNYRNQMEEYQQYSYQIMMEQYIKQLQSNYNAISPISMINQTPMTYTPTQQFQFYYNTFTSPQWNCTPNFDLNSPIIQNLYWQTQQQNYDYSQNEQIRQMQFNHKLEFLNSNNLVDDWKKKRDNLKQNQQFSVMDSLDQ